MVPRKYPFLPGETPREYRSRYERIYRKENAEITSKQRKKYYHLKIKGPEETRKRVERYKKDRADPEHLRKRRAKYDADCEDHVFMFKSYVQRKVQSARRAVRIYLLNIPMLHRRKCTVGSSHCAILSYASVFFRCA